MRRSPPSTRRSVAPQRARDRSDQDGHTSTTVPLTVNASLGSKPLLRRRITGPWRRQRSGSRSGPARSLLRQRIILRSSRKRPPRDPAETRESPQDRAWKLLLTERMPAYPRAARKHKDRSVTRRSRFRVLSLPSLEVPARRRLSLPAETRRLAPWPIPWPGPAAQNTCKLAIRGRGLCAGRTKRNRSSFVSTRSSLLRSSPLRVILRFDSALHRSRHRARDARRRHRQCP